MLTPSPEFAEASMSWLWGALIGIGGVAIGAFLGAFFQSRFARKTARHLLDLQRQDEAVLQVADYVAPILEHVRNFRRIYAEPDGRANSRIDSEVERSVRELMALNEDIWVKRRLRVRDSALQEAFTDSISLLPAPTGTIKETAAVAEWEDWLEKLEEALSTFIQEVERVTQSS